MLLGPQNQTPNYKAESQGSSEQTCAKIQKRSEIRDPQDLGSWILMDLGSYVFKFVEIQWILDLAQDSLSLDSVDLGS